MPDNITRRKALQRPPDEPGNCRWKNRAEDNGADPISPWARVARVDENYCELGE
jgi:hypothetical protein